MGHPVLNPHPVPAPAEQNPRLMTFEDFAVFMQPTGLGKSKATYQRWARQDRLRTWPDPSDPKGKRRLASVSDLLESHRKRQAG